MTKVMAALVLVMLLQATRRVVSMTLQHYRPIFICMEGPRLKRCRHAHDTKERVGRTISLLINGYGGPADRLSSL